MKIQASLVTPPRPLAFALAAALWTLSFVLLAATGWLAWAAVQQRAELPELEARVAQLERQVQQATPHAALPATPELIATKERVAALNALSQVHGWPAPVLLARLEEWLPDQAWLVSLHQRVRTGEVLLVAESPSAELLTTFLLKLEKEPHFAEVLLSKQAQRAGRHASLVQFELRLKERP